MTAELTSDDFCGILHEALGRAAMRVDKEATISLVIAITMANKITNNKVEWSYPNAMVCVDDKGKPKNVVVPRFGSEHIIPGHLKKYLHACRKSKNAIGLYIACPEEAANGYRPQCQLYGLGLLSVSLGKGQVTILERPRNKNIDNAFSTRVRELKTVLKKSVLKRKEELERNLDGFRKEARNQGSLTDVAKHEKPFTDRIAELKQTEDRLILRLNEAAESGDLRQLADLLTEIKNTGQL
jgi:hypothetical protein